MRKKKEEKWKQQLLKALDAEAEQIQQRAEPYKATLSEEKKKEMYANIMARVRQSEEAESREEIPAGEAAATGKKGVVQKPIWRQPLKLAGILLAIGIGVFGTSLISEANRIYWLGKWQELTGSGNVEQSNNGGDSLLTETSEIELREKAKEELGIVVPVFYYMPDGMGFTDGTISLERGRVVSRYQYRNNIIYLTIDKNSSAIVDSVTAKNFDSEIITIGSENDEIEVRFSEDSSESQAVWQSDWIYQNCRYTFGGIIQKAELSKIIEYMHFTE